MKSKAWYIKFPLDAYALGPIRFDVEVDEIEVRKYSKRWSGVKRLPRYFECWITND